MRAGRLRDLSPRKIVAELDKFVVGQPKAKRAVAIALRNRIRRQKLSASMAEEVAPKNIIRSAPPAWARPRSPAAWRASPAAPS